MKKVLSVMLVLCLYLNAYAQKNFEEGFYIGLKSDTINGYLMPESVKNEILSFKYKRLVTDQARTLKAGEIAGVRINNKSYYKSMYFGDTLAKREVFMEVLLGGPITLYKHGGFFYVSKNGSELYKLYSIKQQRSEGGVNIKAAKEIPKYKGVLSYLMSDCEAVQDKISRMVLNEPSLVTLISRYNECHQDAQVTYKTPEPWLKIDFGLALGAVFSGIEFDSYNNKKKDAFVTNGNYSRSNTGTIGVMLNVFTPRIIEGVSLQTGVFYHNSEFQGRTTVVDGSTTTHGDIKIVLPETKIPIGLQYKFKGTNAPYFNAGIAYSTFGSARASADVEVVKQDSRVDYSKIEAFPLKKGQFGVWGGIGLERKIDSNYSLFVETRYERTDGINNNSMISDPTLSSVISNTFLLMGIRIQY